MQCELGLFFVMHFQVTFLHALVQGEFAYLQGELFVVFELWFGGLRSLFEHGFVSDVSSRCLA
jgi:hypothetical protein